MSSKAPVIESSSDEFTLHHVYKVNVKKGAKLTKVELPPFGFLVHDDKHDTWNAYFRSPKAPAGIFLKTVKKQKDAEKAVSDEVKRIRKKRGEARVSKAQVIAKLVAAGHPDLAEEMLVEGAALPDKEAVALDIIHSNRFVKDREAEFSEYKLGKYSPTNPIIKSLIEKGLVEVKGRDIDWTFDGQELVMKKTRDFQNSRMKLSPFVLDKKHDVYVKKGAKLTKVDVPGGFIVHDDKYDTWQTYLNDGEYLGKVKDKRDATITVEDSARRYGKAAVITKLVEAGHEDLAERLIEVTGGIKEKKVERAASWIDGELTYFKNHFKNMPPAAKRWVKEAMKTVQDLMADPTQDAFQLEDELTRIQNEYERDDPEYKRLAKMLNKLQSVM
jgi:hypothetical protein